MPTFSMWHHLVLIVSLCILVSSSYKKTSKIRLGRSYHSCLNLIYLRYHLQIGLYLETLSVNTYISCLDWYSWIHDAGGSEVWVCEERKKHWKNLGTWNWLIVIGSNDDGGNNQLDHLSFPVEQSVLTCRYLEFISVNITKAFSISID